MKSQLPFALFALLLLCTLNVNVYLQSPKNEVCEKDLALQVKYWEGHSPAYQRVMAQGEFGSSAWYALFKMNPKWHQPKDTLPVRAVNIESNCAGDGARIQVSVFIGRESREREEDVGVYTLNENDKMILSGLAKYGIEPFTISLMKKERTTAILPAVDNQAGSLEVTVESVPGTLPTFNVTLINKGAKAVLAVAMESRANGKVKMSTLPRGRRGASLIMPGGSYTRSIPVSLHEEPEGPGNIPEARADEIVVIKTVVFDDGNYEGDPHEAAKVDAILFGERVQLENILQILDKAGETEVKSLDSLESAARSLPDKVEKNRLDDFIRKLGAQDERNLYVLKVTSQVALAGVKHELLDEIESLRGTPDADSLGKWLIATKSEYQHWLDRLPK